MNTFRKKGEECAVRVKRYRKDRHFAGYFFGGLGFVRSTGRACAFQNESTAPSANQSRLTLEPKICRYSIGPSNNATPKSSSRTAGNTPRFTPRRSSTFKRARARSITRVFHAR